MIGLDTNVLVRYLTEDDPRQSRVARRLFETTLSAEDLGFISSITLVELVWVLTGAYSATRPEIAELLERLLATPVLGFEHRDEVRRALEQFRASKVDFADCLMGQINSARGCESTVTFDRRASALSHFRLLAD